MPQAIPVIILAIAASAEVASITWGMVAVAAIMAAASYAMSSLLAPSMDSGESETSASSYTQQDRGHLVNTKSTSEPVPLVYGHTRVGLNVVYIGNSGTDNKYIHLVGTICEGEIEGVYQSGGVDQIWLNDLLWNDASYKSLVYYEIFTGTASQNVCATLNTAIPTWTDPMRNTAYLYMRLEWDKNVWQGLPLITAEVEGLKIKTDASKQSGSLDLVELFVSPEDGYAGVWLEDNIDLSSCIDHRIRIDDGSGDEIVGFIDSIESDKAVRMTYAASGSSGITVADNDNIDFGTGNVTLVRRVALPDWTPSAETNLFKQVSGSGSNYYGYELDVETDGTLRLYLYRNDTATAFTSTAVTALTDGAEAEIACVVTRETATANGSVIFYVNKVKLGNTVTITSAATVSISNSRDLYISGNSAMRYASINKSALLFNRALTADEVLSLYQNGIADADKWGSQTALTSGTLTVGKKYRINVYNADDDFTNVGAAGNVAGTEFVATGTTPTHWAHSSVLVLLGATLALEPAGIGAADWQDSSTNNLDGSYPAAGSDRVIFHNIVSEYQGTDFNWESIDGTFGYTDATYTYEVDPYALTDWDESYSNNPAFCALDFVIRSARRGGMEIATTRVDPDSVSDAASYCTTKGWECNLPLTDNEAATDLLQHILDTFRGALIYSVNKFFLRYKDLNYESSVMALTENDVTESGESSIVISQPSIFDTPNAIRIKYLNSGKRYQADDYILSDSTAIAADGDYREETITIKGVDGDNAKKLAAYYLERMRTNKVIDITTGSRCMALEPHDVVTLTHTVPGWTGKIMRVQSAQLLNSGEVSLNCIEESSAMYDDTYNSTSYTMPDTTLVGPADAVPSVINVSSTEVTYSYRDRTFTRWLVDFAPPPSTSYPFFDHAQVWVSVGSSNAYRFVTKADDKFTLDPVEEGETYYCKLRSVSIFGKVEEATAAAEVSRLILGKATPPANLTGMTCLVNGSGIVIIADELGETDITGYELRYGDSWNGGLLIGFQSKPYFNLTGVKPGIYTFWMAAKDNGGRYSVAPSNRTATVFTAAGYKSSTSWVWDYSGGSFTNATSTTLNGTSAFIVDHSGTSLIGSYESTIHDLGSIKKFRLWGDFLSAIDGNEKWTDLATVSTDAWTRLDATVNTWGAYLVPESSAAVLQSTILCGTSTSLDQSANHFEMHSAEFETRYVKVEFTITDASTKSYLKLYPLNMIAATWAT